MSENKHVNFLLQLYYRDAAGTVIADPGELYAMVDHTGSPSDAISPNGYFDGRVLQASVEEFVFSPGSSRGPRSVNNAGLVLQNNDGELDVWGDRSIHGCPCYLRMIRGDGEVVNNEFTGVLELVDAGDETITFYARDQTFLLLQKQALSKRYAGTNVLPSGLEGTADDIKGQYKPWVLGRVFNFRPPCVNTSLLIYEIDGEEGLRTGWSLVGRDSGITLTQQANYVDVADMEANAPSPGCFRVLAGGGYGYVRIGAGLVGQLTFDVVNPCATAESSVTPRGGGIDESAWHVLVQAVASKSSGHGSVSAYDPAIPVMPVSGLVVTGEMTLLDCINTMTNGSGNGWTYTSGSIATKSVSDPGAYSAGTSDELNEDSIVSSAGKTSLRKVVTNDSDRGIPVWRVVVQYRRNHTIQNDSELSGSVSAADVGYYGQEWRTAVAEDASVKTQWPGSSEILLSCPFWEEADAAALAARLLAVYKVQRAMFQCDVPYDPGYLNWNAWALASTKMIKHPRFNLSAGRAVKVVGRRLNIDRQTITLTLWG